MSWGIKAIGTRANVRAVVMADPNLPSTLKDGIAAILDDITDSYGDSVRVETYGHYGGGYSSIGKLEVEYFKAAVAPAPPEPPSQPAPEAEPPSAALTA